MFKYVRRNGAVGVARRTASRLRNDPACKRICALQGLRLLTSYALLAVGGLAPPKLRPCGAHEKKPMIKIIGLDLFQDGHTFFYSFSNPLNLMATCVIQRHYLAICANIHLRPPVKTMESQGIPIALRLYRSASHPHFPGLMRALSLW